MLIVRQQLTDEYPLSSSRPQRRARPLTRNRPASLPTTEQEFEQYMLDMDRHFAAVGLPIAARSLAALTEAGIDQGASSVRLPNNIEPTAGNYEGDNLLLHAERWFRLRYPDHALVDMDLGRTVVRLHGQLWEYRVVSGGWGHLLHTGDHMTSPATVQTPTGYPNIPSMSPIRRMLPGTDLMQGVIGLPAHLAESLSESERALVVRAYCRGQLAYFWLTRARNHRFIREALSDCSAAVRHLLVTPPALGASKWASLQVVEKVLKSYVHHAGGAFPTRGADGHNLASLARLVRAAGGPAIADADLARIQCSASVRYDAGGLALDDALDAHYACLDIVDEVATMLCNAYPLPTTPRMGDTRAAARDTVQLLAERIGLSGAAPP